VLTRAELLPVPPPTEYKGAYFHQFPETIANASSTGSSSLPLLQAAARLRRKADEAPPTDMQPVIKATPMPNLQT